MHTRLDDTVIICLCFQPIGLVLCILLCLSVEGCTSYLDLLNEEFSLKGGGFIGLGNRSHSWFVYPTSTRD